MFAGDSAYYYSKKSIWGLMQVKEEPYQDPTSSGNWLAVDFIPIKTFVNPLTLEQIKQNEILRNTAIIRQPRLSVVKLSEEEFEIFRQANL